MLHYISKKKIRAHVVKGLCVTIHRILIKYIRCCVHQFLRSKIICLNNSKLGFVCVSSANGIINEDVWNITQDVGGLLG